MEYCGRCGAKVSDDQLFCHKCGGSLVEQRAMNDGAASEQRATSDDTPPEGHAATYTASAPAWTPAPASAPASVPAPPAPAAPTGGEPTAPAITPSQIIASFTGYKGRVELYPAYLRIVHTGILARSSPNRGVTDILLAGLTDLTLTPPGRFTMGYLTAIPHDGHPVPRTAQAAINDYLSLPYLHRYRQGAEEFAGTVSEALENLFPASTPQARPKRVALPRRDIAIFTPRATVTQVATLGPPAPALSVGQSKQRSRRLSGTVWGLLITALLAIVIAAVSGGGSGTSTTASGGDTRPATVTAASHRGVAVTISTATDIPEPTTTDIPTGTPGPTTNPTDMAAMKAQITGAHVCRGADYGGSMPLCSKDAASLSQADIDAGAGVSFAAPAGSPNDRFPAGRYTVTVYQLDSSGTPSQVGALPFDMKVGDGYIGWKISDLVSIASLSFTPDTTYELELAGDPIGGVASQAQFVYTGDGSGASGAAIDTTVPQNAAGGDGSMPTDTPAANAGTGTGPSTGADGGQLASDEGGTGPTAECNDSTTSYSHHPSGTCSHHGGVATWDDHLPHSTP